LWILFVLHFTSACQDSEFRVIIHIDMGFVGEFYGPFRTLCHSDTAFC
jgi:hypothetical protein